MWHYQKVFFTRDCSLWEKSYTGYKHIKFITSKLLEKKRVCWLVGSASFVGFLYCMCYQLWQVTDHIKQFFSCESSEVVDSAPGPKISTPQTFPSKCPWWRDFVEAAWDTNCGQYMNSNWLLQNSVLKFDAGLLSRSGTYMYKNHILIHVYSPHKLYRYRVVRLFYLRAPFTTQRPGNLNRHTDTLV